LVLVLNSGSSSVKFALLLPGSGERLMGGIGERLGTPEALLRVQWFPAAAVEERLPGGTHRAVVARVLEHLAEARPLDAVYAVIFIDAIYVKVREGQVANRPVYLALGVTADGERDILGLWAGEHGDGEGAKYWLRVLSEIKNRGTRDVLMVVCDGLKGLPDAVSAV
jgi:hypothetical protein